MDQKRINQLVSNIDVKKRKYTWNIERYLDDLSVTLDNFNQNSSYLANSFVSRQRDDLKKPAQFNVVRSCVDSLVSKISANKVRPYIHPINGGYLNKQLDRKLRQFFDCYFEEEKVAYKIIEAFRQALIFDSCYLMINPFTYKIEVVPAYCLGLDNNEVAYGKPEEMIIKYNNYPSTFLNLTTSNQYVQYCLAVSCKEHKAFKFVNGELVDSIKYDADELPIVGLYYEKPINGIRTIGLADALEGIQTQIDLLTSKISAANELTPANITFVVEGSSLNKKTLGNRTGDVYSIKMPEGSSSLPVMTQTQNGFDMALIEQLKYLIQSAYEITGISQLSAQSKKPAGVDSGVAMATLADLESERFQTQVDQYIEAYKNLTKLIIKLMPDNADILKESEGLFKWKDAKKQLSQMKISFGTDSVLSKEPLKKTEQINQLSQIGGLDLNTLISSLDSTDLEDIYRNVGAKLNGAEAVITNAVENGIYSVPQFVSYEELKKRIITEENAITANIDLKDEDIIQLLKLQSLETVLDDLIEKNGAVETTDQEVMQDENSGLTGYGNNDLISGVVNENSETNKTPVE